jgi:phosphodiesterase/alkaline phosphatase D-like protein
MKLTRRRLLAGLAVAVAAGSAETLLERSGLIGDSADVAAVAPGSPADLLVDFAQIGDRAGWSSDRCTFVATHEPRVFVRRGVGVVALPAGLAASTAANQPLAVLVQDHDCSESWQTLVFRVTGDDPRPGVLLGATTNRDYMLVESVNGNLVLSRCENATRRTVHVVAAPRLLRGVTYQLDVRQQAGTLSARLCRRARASRAAWQMVVAHPARHGQLGICVTTNQAATAQSLRVRRYALHRATATLTPPRAAVLITGTPMAVSVSVRVICDQPSRVSFEHADNEAFAGSQTTAPVTLDAPSYSARVSLPFSHGTIFWRSHIESMSSSATAITETQQATRYDPSQPLVIGATSCAQLWNTPPYIGLRRFRDAAPVPPCGVVYQGDFGYPANIFNSCYLSQPDFYRDRVTRFLSDPYFRELRAAMPVGFTMDDHDYGPPNNADRTTLYPWTITQWNAYHADPSDAGYFDWRLGDTHCLTLDGRRYCDPVEDPNTPAKTKLGVTQKRWLKHTITNSDAALILVFSADIFASRVSPDCFVQGWPDEYAELMTFFSGVQIGGRRVVVLSGDAHGLRIHHHPDPAGRPNAPTVVEFICSGLRARTWSMNLPNDPTLDPTRRVKGKSGLGMIIVDPAAQPSRSVTLRAISGEDNPPVDLFPPLVLPFAPA